MNFFQSNIGWILSVVSAIVVLLLYICKRKPIANLWDKELLDLVIRIPTFIYDAEVKFQTGERKLAYVKCEIEKYLKCIALPERYTADYEAILDTLLHYVEDVLSTPRKKVVK